MANFEVSYGHELELKTTLAKFVNLLFFLSNVYKLILQILQIIYDINDSKIINLGFRMHNLIYILELTKSL